MSTEEHKSIEEHKSTEKHKSSGIEMKPWPALITVSSSSRPHQSFICKDLDHFVKEICRGPYSSKARYSPACYKKYICEIFDPDKIRAWTICATDPGTQSGFVWSVYPLYFLEPSKIKVDYYYHHPYDLGSEMFGGHGLYQNHLDRHEIPCADCLPPPDG